MSEETKDKQENNASQQALPGNNAPQPTLPGMEGHRAGEAESGYMEELRKAKAELKAIQDKNAKEEADNKRKKAEEDGQLKKLLEETQAELQKARDRISAIDQAKRESLEAKIKTLTKDAQEKLNMFRDKLSLDDLERWVEMEAKAIVVQQSGDGRPTIPQGEAIGGTSKPMAKYKPKYADLIAEKTGRMPEYLEMLTETRNQNETKYTMPMAQFMKNLNIVGGRRLTKQEALNRREGK